MGVALTELLVKDEISFDELQNRTLVIDAYNILYQFITSIRSADGTLLTDTKGRVTSHLSGLLFRFTNLMAKNIKFIFVFDGKTPELKQAEVQRRATIKEGAQASYNKAKEEGDLKAMKKYASRISRLTPEMVSQAKQLLDYMGIPHVQAPAEGESQASHMVKKGDAYAVASQDMDVFLFGAPTVIRNLTLSKKRKVAGKLSFNQVMPERLSLSHNLKTLNLTHEQLIALGLLIGTDYNIGGIKGIGPKKALALVRKHGTDFGTLFAEVGWSDIFQVSWSEVFDYFLHPNVTDDYVLKWRSPDTESIRHMLIDDFEFSEDRIRRILDDLGKKRALQTGLCDFF